MRSAFRYVAGGLLACLWLPSSGQARAGQVGRGAVSALAFSVDGARLAVGGQGRVVIFDATSGQQVGALTDVDGAVRAMAFSPDGKRLAAGSGRAARSGQVTIWDMAGGAVVATLKGYEDAVEAIAWSADGRAILTASDDAKARLYADVTRQECRVLDQHNGRVLGASLPTGQGRFFVTCAADRLVKVWDREPVEPVVSFDQCEEPVTGVALLSDGQHMIGASLDGKLRWWRAGYDEKEKAFYGYVARTVDAHAGGVLALALASAAPRAATGGMDGKVCVWDAWSGAQVRSCSESAAPAYAVAISPDGKRVAGGGRDGVAWVWDVESGKLVHTLTPPPVASSRPPAAPAAISRKATP